METEKGKEEVKREREEGRGGSKYRQEVCVWKCIRNSAEMEYFVLSISETWT